MLSKAGLSRKCGILCCRRHIAASLLDPHTYVCPLHIHADTWVYLDVYMGLLHSHFAKHRSCAHSLFVLAGHVPGRPNCVRKFSCRPQVTPLVPPLVLENLQRLLKFIDVSMLNFRLGSKIVNDHQKSCWLHSFYLCS